MGAGGCARPGARTQPSTRHAAAARRAVAESRAAKAAGDDRLAALYASLAAQYVDRHLAALRARERRLS